MSKPIVYHSITVVDDEEYITITNSSNKSQKIAYEEIKAVCAEHELECYLVNDILFCTRPQFAMLYLHFGDKFDFIEK